MHRHLIVYYFYIFTIVQGCWTMHNTLPNGVLTVHSNETKTKIPNWSYEIQIKGIFHFTSSYYSKNRNRELLVLYPILLSQRNWIAVGIINKINFLIIPTVLRFFFFRIKIILFQIFVCFFFSITNENNDANTKKSRWWVGACAYHIYIREKNLFDFYVTVKFICWFFTIIYKVRVLGLMVLQVVTAIY